MPTHAATDASARAVEPEPIMTTDIDLTADLADPPAANATSTPAWQPLPRRESITNALPTRTAEAREPVQMTVEAQPRLPLAPGRVLRDRYVLTQIIGIGGMCTVFRARDLEAHGGAAFIALKTPRPDCADPVRAVERLRHEFHCARNLAHSGIVQVFDLDCDGDIWFMTMELLEGESLATIMRRQGSALAPHLTRRTLRGIGDALGYAHAIGVAHGDLNPANVFVMKGDRIKLIDFGAASRAGTKPAAAATLAYASPQVLEGAAPEIRDDVFSFACIAFEALTGQHPFAQRSALAARAEGNRPELPSTLPNDQVLALMAALAFERDARPDDIKTLAKTLAPDPQRNRTYAIEPELEVQPPALPHDKRWWIFAGVCVVAMIASVFLTRIA